MASLSTQTASSSHPSSSSSFSSSSIPHWNYEVFLSFRGEDTRTNFTDHLYEALKRSGIYTFRDDLELERGKVIRPELLKAIEASRFSIIIFSTTYASSKWCLDELVKIVECKNHMGQEVFPVFYDVDPYDVRNQTGHFQEDFAQHEQDFRDNQEKVQKWRTVMKEVGNLSGFHLKADRLESEFIQDIVKEISSKLSPPSVNKFVGMDLRLKNLSLKIDLESNDVWFVGICGMGGIGKTTLASVFHSRMSCLFEGRSFLADVRKNPLISLQEKLLSQTLGGCSFMIQNVDDGSSMIKSRLCRKKVLVIIDDVDDVNQLEKLAGNHDWFGSGSRIIITTRDEHLLKAHGVDVYKVDGLNHDEALELFSSKAFKDYPLTDCEKLSTRVVQYASGLPLALEVFGSFLCGRSIAEWKSALERLEEDSGTEIMDVNKKIMNTLQISFDGLAETYQKIFLDIACFFKGEDINFVTKILDIKSIEIEVLIEKCLIVISEDNNKLWMHDLLQEMAKKIVQKASPNELGKHSRLWDEEDVRHVLTNNLGTETVEVIISSFSEQGEVPLRAKVFSNMKKLRMLQIQDVKLPQGLHYLSNELRFLKWHRYPLKSLPSSFHPDKIVVLEMCYSRIQQLWKGIKEPLNKLKFINLSHSENLTKMPDFTWIPNLESVILEGCTGLLELHPSIGDLKRLVVLNLKDCKSLSSLSGSIKWESLEVCILAGCSRQFPPYFSQSMKNFEELSFREWKGAPQKSWRLSSPFQRRSLEPMAWMLSSLSSLSCLKKLDLSDCNLWEGAIPNDLGGFSSLEVLDLSNNNFVSLPTSINQLSNLEELDLSDCNLWEGAIPNDLRGLSSLEVLDLSNNHFVSLPTSINQLSNLDILYLDGCKRLKSLPVLPPNILEIKVLNCTSMELLPDALKSLPVQNTIFNSFIGYNCMKLVDNEGGSNLIFAMVKRSLLQGRHYDIVVPGSEIPKWFSHQSEGASTRIERTALSDEKFIGVVLCCVFVLHEVPSLPQALMLRFKLGSPDSMISTIAGNFSPHYVWKTADRDDSFGRAHLWLRVIPAKFRSLDENQLIVYCPSSFLKRESSFDKNHFIFEFANRCPGTEVKKFGIRLIYKLEGEELNQTSSPCSSSTFQNFNQDLDNSTLDGARIEKLSDECSYRSRRRKFSISIKNLGAVWEDL